MLYFKTQTLKSLCFNFFLTICFFLITYPSKGTLVQGPGPRHVKKEESRTMIKNKDVKSDSLKNRHKMNIFLSATWHFKGIFHFYLSFPVTAKDGHQIWGELLLKKHNSYGALRHNCHHRSEIFQFLVCSKMFYTFIHHRDVCSIRSSEKDKVFEDSRSDCQLSRSDPVLYFYLELQCKVEL